MASLLDYVGTAARVGKRNNIWTNSLFFFSNSGEGTFNELSPGRVIFSGNTTFMGRTEPFYLKVELLSNTRCNVIFQGFGRNIPYRVQEDTFVARLSADALFYISRYNRTETLVRVTVHTGGGGTACITYHIQTV